MAAERVLLSDHEFLFECKFMIHGLCVAACMQKAAELKTRQEQYDATVASQKIDKLRNQKENEYSYVVLNCPCKLILKKKSLLSPKSYTTYELVRHELNHIH